MHRLARIALVTTAIGSTVVAALYGTAWYMESRGLLPSSEPDFEAAEDLPTIPEGLRIEAFAQLDGTVTNIVVDPTSAGGLVVTLLDGRLIRLDASGNAGTPFGDLRSRTNPGGERGLLGIAFSPTYANDRRVYMNYTDLAGDTVVARYRTGPDNALDVNSEEILLQIEQPYSNHNGGQLAFGPDGMLYVGTGDGGSAGDPQENAERLDTLLGKILRIDVSGETGYTVPPDNPFVGRSDGAAEIWSWGLRNPWRFAFDPVRGDLYVADVGQGDWEEITVIERGMSAGQDLGWDVLEGSHCYEPATGCDRTGRLMPAFTYGHDLGCSVTGGAVLGPGYGPLSGQYVFADFCSGVIWTIARSAGSWSAQVRLRTTIRPTTFGVDGEGTVLIGGAGGEMVRIRRSN